jgi:hypothetical protein
MRSAECFMMAFADHNIVAHQDCANNWISSGPTQAKQSKVERSIHPMFDRLDHYNSPVRCNTDPGYLK